MLKSEIISVCVLMPRAFKFSSVCAEYSNVPRFALKLPLIGWWMVAYDNIVTIYCNLQPNRDSSPAGWIPFGERI